MTPLAMRYREFPDVMLCAVVTLLTCGSWLLFTAAPQFEIVSKELLTNHQFDDGTRGWQQYDITHDAASFVIAHHQDGIPAQAVFQRFRSPGTAHLAASVRFDFRVESPTALARIDLYNRDADTGRYQWFANIYTTRTPGSYDMMRVVAVPDAAGADLQVEAEVYGTGGVLDLATISVQPAVPQQWFVAGRTTLLVAWAVAGLLAALLLIRRQQHWTEIALAGALATGLLLLDEASKDQLLVRFAATGIPGLDHLLPFFLVALAVFIRNSGWRPLVVMLTLAIALEALQHFTRHRTPLLSDTLLNLAAVAIAFSMVRLWQFRDRLS